MMTDSIALELAREIAAFLTNEHGATKVLFICSWAKGTAAPDSDIDIYFEGLSRNHALQAVGRCIYNFGERRIDYLPDCFCEAHFRKRALAHGKPL